MGHKAIDLFAGPGGLSLGLIKSGFDVIAAIEFDEAAGKTYRHNIGEHTVQRDITGFEPAEFRSYLLEQDLLDEEEGLALIAGGPPCPGFSLIGRSKISDLIKKGEYGDSVEYRHRFIDDPRNELFREFVKYVDEFQPHYFLMENVSGMTSYQIDDDPIVDVIQNSFAGYIVDWQILRACDFGVPQNRRRIIFLGHREGLMKPNFPEATHRGTERDAADAILDLSLAEPTADGVVRLPTDPQSSGVRGYEFRREMRQWEVRGRKSVTGRKTCHWTRGTNERDDVLFQFILSGASGDTRGNVKIPDSSPRQIYGDIFPSKWNSELRPAFKKAGMRAWKRGRCHVESSGGKRWLMYEQDGFKDKMRRIRWDRPAPTVVAHLAKDGYMFIHPWKNRTITVREAARFQSFPDSFEFKGSMTSQFRQVGNAVPPLLAKVLGKSIIDALGN
jgi:DNA (cytosine-5)-methyltransferase 1